MNNPWIRIKLTEGAYLILEKFYKGRMFFSKERLEVKMLQSLSNKVFKNN